ncbi:hypothetical protein OHC33_001487 [Knufia fluminis]|uniref:Uncharacterized protein n=1 Tax=Knufia fluminis TaxID=191047 RepID=A0AAN8F5L9_9EURO|nr:hypothetical protein OHC33_001487 [Knufia fluminis]
MDPSSATTTSELVIITSSTTVSTSTVLVTEFDVFVAKTYTSVVIETTSTTVVDTITEAVDTFTSTIRTDTTTTVPTPAGFAPVQDTLPDASYVPPAVPKRRDISQRQSVASSYAKLDSPATRFTKQLNRDTTNLEHLKRTLSISTTTSIIETTSASTVVTTTTSILESSTSSAATTTSYDGPVTTIVTTIRTTSTPTSVITATLTISTTTSVTDTVEITETITDTQYTTISSFDACLPNNMANFIGPSSIYNYRLKPGAPGTASVPFPISPKNLYQCCVAANSNTMVNSWWWSNRVNACKSFVLDVCPGPEAASPNEVVLSSIRPLSYVVGNANCGRLVSVAATVTTLV